MKYIFLLTLFIICFTLMYTTTLELLGLGLFFVVNLAYSVMLGNDLSSLFKNSGADPSTRWTKMLAVLIIIALSMNFASSVLTMMTLGNLQAKFGKKGEKLMLSPKYRSELSSVEGMFVAIIVLITILSFRLYFSPTQMAEGVFSWVSQTIPDDYIKWGHLLLAFVVMGLALGLFSLIDRRKIAEETRYEKEDGKRKFQSYTDYPLLPEDFRVNFTNLFWVLTTIFLVYFVPTFIPMFGYFNGSSMSSMMSFFTNPNSSVSTFTLFKLLFVPLTMAIAVTLNKFTSVYNDNTNGDISEYSSLGTDKIEEYAKGRFTGYQSLIVLGITTMVFYLLTLAGNILTYLLSLKNIMFFNINFSGFLNTIINAILNGADGIVSVCILALLIHLQVKHGNIFDAPKNTTTDTPYIYHKVLTSLLFLFPAVFFIIILSSLRTATSTKASGFLHTFRSVFSINTHFLWNFVDAFWAIRTFLVMLAVIFAGLTINSYNNIEDLTKFHKYYHLKELFVSFIVFLMVILPFSLFDTKNVPRIMTVVVEYLSPIAVIIMMCLLVIYSNDLSKLSNKELVGDISSEDDEATPVAPPTKDKISRNVFDGISHAI